MVPFTPKEIDEWNPRMKVWFRYSCPFQRGIFRFQLPTVFEGCIPGISQSLPRLEFDTTLKHNVSTIREDWGYFKTFLLQTLRFFSCFSSCPCWIDPRQVACWHSALKIANKFSQAYWWALLPPLVLTVKKVFGEIPSPEGTMLGNGWLVVIHFDANWRERFGARGF